MLFVYVLFMLMLVEECGIDGGCIFVGLGVECDWFV